MQASLKEQVTAIRGRPGGSRLYPALKRILDVAISLSITALTLPLWACIAVCIKVDSRGSVIFRQTRIGTHGREFALYKFRSMNGDIDDASHRESFRRYADGQPVDHDEHGPLYKKIVDPRITRVGKFLRATNLDELPQLMNVLRGQMSIVGPRPMLPYHLSEYKSWYHQRHQVPQGITGLWQIKGRNRVNLEDMVRLDLDYIKHRSLWLDLRLMVLTMPGMLRAPKADTKVRREKA